MPSLATQPIAVAGTPTPHVLAAVSSLDPISLVVAGAPFAALLASAASAFLGHLQGKEAFLCDK